MKLVVMSIFDRAAEVYGRPFFAQSVGVAVRSFQDEVTRTERGNTLAEHPSDFALWQLGEFEDSTGEFSLFDVPSLVITGDKVKGVANAS